MVAQQINNVLENGYIEKEIKSQFPGKGSVALNTINSAFIEDTKSNDDALAVKDASLFGVLMTQIQIV